MFSDPEKQVDTKPTPKGKKSDYCESNYLGEAKKVTKKKEEEVKPKPKTRKSSKAAAKE